MSLRGMAVAMALAVAVSCSREKRGADRADSAKAATEAAGAAPAGSAHEHVDEPAHDELPKRVRLSKDVIADAKIRTAPVARESLAATLTLPGEIAADPDQSARVSVG